MYFGDVDPTPHKSRPQLTPTTVPLPPRPTPASSNKKRHLLALWSGCTAIILLIVVAAASFFYAHRATNSLPASFIKNANLTLYYPSPLPLNYTYKEGSAKTSGGSLFYTIENGKNKITVSEQALPSNPPDLTHLTGYTTFNTLAGNAAIGSSMGLSIAILVTNTTLITLQGNSATPQAIVGDATRAMSPLQQ